MKPHRLTLFPGISLQIGVVAAVLGLLFGACAPPPPGRPLPARVPTLAAAEATRPAAGPPAAAPTRAAPENPQYLPIEKAAGTFYNIGSPVVADLYLSPTGSDAASNPGSDPKQPLRTLSEAWARLPETVAATGYRLNFLPGTYPCEPGPEDSNCINYFSDRAGTAQFPLILRALNGPGTVTLRGGLNFNRVSYLYLIDLSLVGGGPLPTNSAGNNLLHLEQGKHVLLRGLSIEGPACDNDACNNLQEVLKVNQSEYIYVENSRLSGAWHSVVDYFVVQYGHFLNNEVHTAGQWCMYVKGGSAYLAIAGNEFHNCQLGFQSGQSANLAVMRSPWFHYETYDIKFYNNLLHDIPGVGLSAAGAYNTLFAFNTLYRVGISADPGYPLVQLVAGERNCTPVDEIPDVVRSCPVYVAQGAWGPVMEAEGLPAIPNRNVYVYNNLIYNPGPARTLYTHFNIGGPALPPPGFKNMPSPYQLDDHLVMAGNLIWNGPADLALGIEDPDQGCQAGNPTCNAAQLAASNTINKIEPQLAGPESGNYRPKAGGNLSTVRAVAIPAFAWDAFTPPVPAGTLPNVIPADRAGQARSASGPPGAYVGD